MAGTPATMHPHACVCVVCVGGEGSRLFTADQFNNSVARRTDIAHSSTSHASCVALWYNEGSRIERPTYDQAPNINQI